MSFWCIRYLDLPCCKTKILLFVGFATLSQTILLQDQNSLGWNFQWIFFSSSENKERVDCCKIWNIEDYRSAEAPFKWIGMRTFKSRYRRGTETFFRLLFVCPCTESTCKLFLRKIQVVSVIGQSSVSDDFDFAKWFYNFNMTLCEMICIILHSEQFKLRVNVIV